MLLRTIKASTKLLCLVLLAIFFQSLASAQCPTAPGDSGVVAAPSRPNYTNNADILQEGVTEFEYGYSHAWNGTGGTQTDLPALLRFAVTCNIEVRISSDNFTQLSQGGQSNSGLGDSWLTAQYQFWRQTPKSPSMAFAYGVKFPIANSSDGLGTGKFDHQITFLADKTDGQTTVAFNAIYTLAGRTSGSGFDRNKFFSAAFSRPLHGPIGITGEMYGATQLNSLTPGYAGTLWALTYNRTPRLVFDAGIDKGLTAGVPHQRVVFGVSYAIGEAYSWLRPHHRPAEE
jgi:hypothetical protein